MLGQSAENFIQVSQVIPKIYSRYQDVVQVSLCVVPWHTSHYDGHQTAKTGGAINHPKRQLSVLVQLVPCRERRNAFTFLCQFYLMIASQKSKEEKYTLSFNWLIASGMFGNGNESFFVWAFTAR